MVCALTVLKLYDDGVCINCAETCAVLGDVCRATAVQAGGHGFPRCHRQDPAGGTAPTVRPLALTFAGSWWPLCNKTDALQHSIEISLKMYTKNVCHAY